MPYKDAEKQKKATKEAVKRYRDKVLQKDGVIPANNVIPDVQPIEHSVYQCIMSSGRQVTPTLLNALVDPVEREKLEAICASLATRNKMDRVYYGISGLTMADVSELLETTA